MTTTTEGPWLVAGECLAPGCSFAPYEHRHLADGTVDALGDAVEPSGAGLFPQPPRVDAPTPLDVVLAAVRDEVERAQAHHGPMRSAHEGYAVLLEEVDELWAEVKADKLPDPLGRLAVLAAEGVGQS